jgi:hypothetical protein
MIGVKFSSFRGLTMATLGLATVIGVTAGAPATAQARVFIGIGVPFFYGPAYIPPPVYYPPPYYYAPPPPVVYAPPRTYTPSPASDPSGPGQTCYAGQYVCPMDRPVPSGYGCYCIGNGGQRVNGHAS